MSQAFGPQEFLRLAKRAGFSVDAYHSVGESAWYRISITSELEPRAEQEEVDAAKRIGLALMETLPRYKSEEPQKIEVNVYPQGDGYREDGGCQVEVSVKDVEPDFQGQVERLVQLQDADKRRRKVLNQRFEAKMAEEIEADPEIIERRDAVLATQNLLQEQLADLKAKRAAMRRQRKGLRKSFLYVADEREL